MRFDRRLFTIIFPVLLLVQFLARLSFGTAAAMLVTSPRLVAGGYYRNNCYVLLGLNVLAASALRTGAAASPAAFWSAVGAAGAAYVGAVAWLYEKPRVGAVLLAAVVAASAAVAQSSTAAAGKTSAVAWLYRADAVVGGLLLGTTTAAMLLGHWYLNAPGMKIAPLAKLNLLIGAIVLVRCLVSGTGLALTLQTAPPTEFAQIAMIALRWLAGMFGTAVLVLMTRETLKLGNTQASTGLLYVAVITVFLGELLGQLLSLRGDYPL